MADVNSKNRRSAPTRRRIVAAAHGLFAERGYAGTTFQEVADAAGVSVQTVYFHYGSKSGLLKHVVDVASVGDDEPVPLLERPWFKELSTTRDPRQAIALWTHASGEIFDRVAAILAVVRDAAAGDPEMAEQWQVNSGQRRTAHETFTGILEGLGALRPELDRRRATDITVGLLSPDLFLVLQRECSWSTAEWEEWAAGQLAHALLPL
ncbi:DNA-binding transcriptional regulator, AcrR family [Nonomuraea solani]|uniref:DNA-binding transcriptional regulator, AcrR family n=1 Tax=Nonomuraea solani TaxID=1144553 RepID=A0A1H6ELX6_9ACTN|nr:TetR/AcrR family transcriptional regulator [Nonomuraea solani]SEG98091.1 DNA-binding transcriptional regulator, AcrR family [Nonomuraea solani]